VTDEISIRTSRARRGAELGDALPSSDPTPNESSPGETAWHLGASLPEAERSDEQKGQGPPPFPPFPGLGDGDEEAAGPGLDVQRFVRGLWKRRWIVVSVAAAVTLLFGALAFTLLTHKWEAAAVLVLRTHQDKFALGSSTPFKPQEYNLKTLLDTVKLPSSLDAVMKATGISVPRRTLAAAIDVSPGKDSNMFQVKVTWEDPRIAAQMANEVARMLIERSRAMRREDAEEVFDYYGAQLEEARASRRAITAEMRVFQEGEKAADFDTETKVLIEELSRLEADHSTLSAEAQAMRTAGERLEKLIAEQPEMVVISTIYRSPLKQRLTDYEWQLQEALSRYTVENPKVIKLQKRIAVLEQMIDESKDEGAPQNTYAPNTQLADMKMRLQELTDELKVREAQVAALARTTQGMRDKLARLTASKKEYELIRSRLEGAETLEANLISRVDEARVIMLRDEASFDLVEPARPPEEPLSSGRKLVVAGGMVLGTGAGIFLALLLELLDPAVRSRRDAMDLSGCEQVWEFQRVPPGAHSVIDTRSPTEPVATLFRRLVNELESRLDDEQWRCLAITSVAAGAGRSLTATNLAQAIAMKEHSAILVDADLRGSAGLRPAHLFGLPEDRPGLRDALRDDAMLPDLLSATETRGLHFLGPGTAPKPEDAGNEALMALGGRQMRAIVRSLEQTGRRILYDLPPLAAQETVVEAAAAVGNLVIVVRSGHTRRDELKEIAEMLREREIAVRAVLLTDVPAETLSGKPVFGKERPNRRERAESIEPTLGNHV
jgi:uncharacterized protein involved in exopolysaccharide biosynthesis/Mrp family chromosome partitioning ATPase